MSVSLMWVALAILPATPLIIHGLTRIAAAAYFQEKLKYQERFIHTMQHGKEGHGS